MKLTEHPKDGGSYLDNGDGTFTQISPPTGARQSPSNPAPIEHVGAEQIADTGEVKAVLRRR